MDDQPVTFSGPGDAMAAGIGMVHQHFMLIPVFTVTENVMLGHEEISPFGMLSHRKARRRVAEISRQYGLEVPPDALVAHLPVGVQQRVEILKALSQRRPAARARRADRGAHPAARPTTCSRSCATCATPARRSCSSATSCNEVREIADRITVIRRGKVVGTAAADGVDAASWPR